VIENLPEYLRKSSSTKQMDIQVTSRGCARANIIFVLWHCWDYVRGVKADGGIVSFPFDEVLVQTWIDKAFQNCCCSTEFMNLFGGTQFNSTDPSTFWTHPSNFFTW
jgi:hypothetical protein